MTDIFISYSRVDIDVAQQLAQNLQELGYTVWWDMTGLHGGQTFASVIQQKLSEAQCAIVLWSPDSVVSNWVHSEASFADSRGILLTAMYRESQAPMPFNNRHNEDLRNWNGNVFDDGFQKLLKAITQYCPTPSGKPRQAELVAKPDEVETPAVTQEPSKPSNTQNVKPSEQLNRQPVKPIQTIKLEGVAGDINGTSKPTGTGDGGSAASGLTKKILATAVAIAIGATGYFLYTKAQQPKLNQNNQVSPGQTLSDSTNNPPASVVSAAQATLPQVDDVKQQLSKVTASLLKQANEALDKNYLTTPENNSVMHFAGRVLQGDPKNDEALGLLTKAASRYQQWAASSIAKKQYENAQGYLDGSNKLINTFSLSEAGPKQKELSATIEAALTKQAEEKAATSQIYQLDNDLTLVPIPAGSFMMGSNVHSFEKPVHKVTFAKPLWMSKTEITFDQYDAYAVAAGKEKPNDSGWGRGDRPAIYVSWNDAQGYVKWLSQNNNQGLQCRLPSEAEWEYAARAGTNTKYFWGDQVGKNNANCKGCDRRWGGEKTAPVASYSANKWGLHDMHGNAWEWVQDPWHKDYTGAPNTGEVWEKDGDASRRVLRGGSWGLTPVSLRSANRGGGLTPGARGYVIGFRIVCSSH